MRRIASLVLATVVSAPNALAEPHRADDTIDHAALAQEMLARHGHADADPAEFSLERFLTDGFVRTRVGLFELHVSVHAAADKNAAADVAKMIVALLDAQEAWLDWLGEDAPAARETRKDLETLRGWAKRVRGDVIADAARNGPGDLLEMTNAKDRVREAAARFGESMAKGIPLGIDRADAFVEPIVLAPKRREFLELLSLFGWMMPDLRYVYWSQDVYDWTNTYFNDVTLIAMEFAAPRTSSGGFPGISMNARTDTGMEQQLVQLCTNALVDNYYGSRIPPSVAGAFAVNLVIDVYGECNTRVDGDLRARRTDAREVFVPGAPSDGFLPPNLADSRWRLEHGKDHFTVALKIAQDAGASEAGKPRDDTRHFELHNDAGNERRVVSGPFLGSAAEMQEEVEEAFYGDSLEFYRSYRTCFVHWLRTEAQRSRRASEEAFAELLIRLAAAEDVGDLESVVGEVYGEPLSDEEPDRDDLEGSFLEWLSRL